MTAKGVRLRGACVTGQLDLDGIVLRCPLSLDKCYLDASHPVCFDHASASRIALTGCQLNGLAAEMLTAQEIDLSRSTLTGPVRLLGATIASQVICRGAHLTGVDADGDSLVADGMQTGGSVFLDQGFTAIGAVRLANAKIGRQLDCRGGQLTGSNRDGNALIADGMQTGGSVLLHHEFRAKGTVRLAGASITGQLSCRNAELAGTDSNSALMANDIKVSGDVLLDGDFKTAGVLRLAGADIGGELRCAGELQARVISDVLVADGMKAAGGVVLEESMIATGAISFQSASITGRFSVNGKLAVTENETALSVQSMQVAGALEWAPAAAVLGFVSLEGAAVRELDDTWQAERRTANGYWPINGRLNLRGFEYDRLGGDCQTDPTVRLNWIRSQYLVPAEGTASNFATQPYEQLAAVWRRAGEDGAARKAAIARRADLRKYGNLNLYRKVGNGLLDHTIKYGYQAWRAGAGLAVLFVLFFVLAIIGQHQHFIVPVGNTTGLNPPPTELTCSDNYPCFYPVGYAVDIVIPIINVHQAEYWGLDGSVSWGWLWVIGAWVATGLGWALATLLVAGYTGLVRQQ